MGGWWSRGGRQERVLELILRVGVAGCFIGHGAFGIIGKEGWLPYFTVFGVPESWAWFLMPVVGSVDIAIGTVALLTPRPWVLAYAAGWAIFTALLRPLAGESVFETLERAGNYGIPLAFLVAAGAGVRSRWRHWLRPASVLPLTQERRRRVGWVLRGTLSLLLVGHGGLAALSGKELLAEHLAVVGIDPGLLGVMGLGEIVLGVAVAWRPAPLLLVLALGWKLATEALYPVSGAPLWEFVERAGSYAAPLALLALSPAVARRLRSRSEGREGEPLLVRGAISLLGIAVLVGAYSTSTVEVGDGGEERLQARVLEASPVGAPGDTTVLAQLRDGGMVLACRHAVTDRSRGDRRPVDYDDPSTQRVLSEAGREQARELGRVLMRLDVPIGDVLASPYSRTEETAELAFGRSVRTEALVYGDSREQRRERKRLLAEPPVVGNRVLMTHQGILYDNLPTVERGSIREGDCVVVRPDGEAYEALVRLGPEEFRRLEGRR